MINTHSNAKKYSKTKHCPKSGFSVLEMVIVVFIVGSLMAVYITSLRKTDSIVKFRNTQSNILYALQSARNRALNGTGSINGVSVNGNQIIEYKGSGLNSTVDFLPYSVSNTENITIMFDRLTAKSNTGTITTIGPDGNTASIIIEPNGTITAQ